MELPESSNQNRTSGIKTDRGIGESDKQAGRQAGRQVPCRCVMTRPPAHPVSDGVQLPLHLQCVPPAGGVFAAREIRDRGIIPTLSCRLNAFLSPDRFPPQLTSRLPSLRKRIMYKHAYMCTCLARYRYMYTKSKCFHGYGWH